MSENKEIVATDEESKKLSLHAQSILNEDLSFLKEMSIHESGGKRYLGTATKAFNIEWRLTESEFVKNWLIQFALGNDMGVNYFNIAKWMEKTNKGQGLVEIFSDATETEASVSLFIIPPLMAVNMSNSDYQLIRHAIQCINSNMVDEQATRLRDSNKPIADELGQMLSGKRIPIPNHVPDWFYERHNVVPLVEQQCFFIRDIVNADKKSPHEDYYKLRDILYKRHKGEKLSAEEKAFAVALSRDTIEWGDVKENKTSNTTNVEEDDGFDPLSC